MLKEATDEIRDEIGDTPSGSLHEALLTRGEDMLSYGLLEANIETNSRTVYIDLNYAGGMASTMSDVREAAEAMLGIPLPTLREFSRFNTEEGSPDYMLTMKMKVPTSDLLNLVGREEIIQ